MADQEQPFTSHVGELRRRLFWSVLVLVATTGLALVFYRRIFSALLVPAQGMNAFTGGLPVFTDVTEFWGATLKVALLTGFALSIPFFLFQAVRFVAPALNSRERRWLYFLLPFSLLSFAGGVAFGYYVLLPPTINFLISFGSGIAAPLIRIGSYINLVTMVLFWMGICFELPIVMFFLTRVGVVTPQWFSGKRRYWIVLAFIIGAVLTPPLGPVNQAIVAGPLLVLYELGILLSKAGARQRAAASFDAAE